MEDKLMGMNEEKRLSFGRENSEKVFVRRNKPSAVVPELPPSNEKKTFLADAFVAEAENLERSTFVVHGVRSNSEAEELVGLVQLLAEGGKDQVRGFQWCKSYLEGRFSSRDVKVPPVLLILGGDHLFEWVLCFDDVAKEDIKFHHINTVNREHRKQRANKEFLRRAKKRLEKHQWELDEQEARLKTLLAASSSTQTQNEFDGDKRNKASRNAKNSTSDHITDELRKRLLQDRYHMQVLRRMDRFLSMSLPYKVFVVASWEKRQEVERKLFGLVHGLLGHCKDSLKLGDEDQRVKKLKDLRNSLKLKTKMYANTVDSEPPQLDETDEDWEGCFHEPETLGLEMSQRLLWKMDVEILHFKIAILCTQAHFRMVQRMMLLKDVSLEQRPEKAKELLDPALWQQALVHTALKMHQEFEAPGSDEDGHVTDGVFMDSNAEMEEFTTTSYPALLEMLEREDGDAPLPPQMQDPLRRAWIDLNSFRTGWRDVDWSEKESMVWLDLDYKVLQRESKEYAQLAEVTKHIVKEMDEFPKLNFAGEGFQIRGKKLCSDATMSDLAKQLTAAVVAAKAADAVIVTDIVAPRKLSPLARLLYTALEEHGFNGPVIGVASEAFSNTGFGIPIQQWNSSPETREQPIERDLPEQAEEGQAKEDREKLCWNVSRLNLQPLTHLILTDGWVGSEKKVKLGIAAALVAVRCHCWSSDGDDNNNFLSKVAPSFEAIRKATIELADPRWNRRRGSSLRNLLDFLHIDENKPKGKNQFTITFKQLAKKSGRSKANQIAMLEKTASFRIASFKKYWETFAKGDLPLSKVGVLCIGLNQHVVKDLESAVRARWPISMVVGDFLYNTSSFSVEIAKIYQAWKLNLDLTHMDIQQRIDRAINKQLDLGEPVDWAEIPENAASLFHFITLGEVSIHHIHSKSYSLQRELFAALDTDNALKNAQQFRALYRSNMLSKRKISNWLLTTTLMFSVLQTVAAVSNSYIEDFRTLVVILPALTSFLYAISEYVDAQTAYLTMERAEGLAAEAIYRYRTRSGKFSFGSCHDQEIRTLNASHDQPNHLEDPDADEREPWEQAKHEKLMQDRRNLLVDILARRQYQLSQDLKAIAASVGEDVSIFYPHSLDGIDFPPIVVTKMDSKLYSVDPDEQTYLDGDDYVWERLSFVQEQIQLKASRYQLIDYNIKAIVSLLGAAGSIMATLQLERWVPVSAAVVTALGVWAQANRFSKNISSYRSVSKKLADIRSKWLATPQEVRVRQDAIDNLVEETEDAIYRLLPELQDESASASSSSSSSSSSRKARTK